MMTLIISVKKILKNLKVPCHLEMYAHELLFNINIKQTALDIERHTWVMK